MAAVENEFSKEDKKLGLNWWKILFFVALIAFEFAREFAVVSSAKIPTPNTNAIVSDYGGFALAQGSWKRIDGGGAMVPATITIECRRETNRCIEASTMIYKNSVFAPELDWFDAKFTTDAITFENDRPDCARYSVRIDLKLKKAFAVRERVENPNNSNCKKLERRIEMQLGDGYDSSADNRVLDDHFLPFFKIIAAIF